MGDLGARWDRLHQQAVDSTLDDESIAQMVGALVQDPGGWAFVGSRLDRPGLRTLLLCTRLIGLMLDEPRGRAAVLAAADASATVRMLARSTLPIGYSGTIGTIHDHATAIDDGVWESLAPAVASGAVDALVRELDDVSTWQVALDVLAFCPPEVRQGPLHALLAEATSRPALQEEGIVDHIRALRAES